MGVPLFPSCPLGRKAKYLLRSQEGISFGYMLRHIGAKFVHFDDFVANAFRTGREKCNLSCISTRRKPNHEFRKERCSPS
jgi:hypothetical protein